MIYWYLYFIDMVVGFFVLRFWFYLVLFLFCYFIRYLLYFEWLDGMFAFLFNTKIVWYIVYYDSQFQKVFFFFQDSCAVILFWIGIVRVGLFWRYSLRFRVKMFDFDLLFRIDLNLDKLFILVSFGVFIDIKLGFWFYFCFLQWRYEVG